MGEDERGRLSDPVFFLDRDLGRLELATLLRKAGLRVEAHFDHFVDTTPDENWLASVGERGWIAISGDKGIRRSPPAISRIAASSTKLWLLSSRGTAAENAQAILAAKNRILQRSRRRGHVIGTIYRDGTIRIHASAK